jgi:glycolate oxidase FAD binding subunit
MIRAGDLAALRDALGGAAVREHEPLEVEGAALAVTLAPADGEALGGALRELAARGLRALVRGGGTRLDLGNPPAGAGVLLSLAELAGIEELDAEEGVARVRAGTPVAALREAARCEGWEPPLDPPGATSTVGGVLAAAVVGPRSLRFGPPRDAVLGLDVALASGARTRCGGRVVKNVTGYDLAKLYTGSLGTLGVIEAAWLRLRPLPERVTALSALLPAGPRRFALGLAAARLGTARAALILDPAPAGSLGIASGAVSCLVIELAGDAAAVDADRASLLGELPAAAAAPELVDRARELQGEPPGPRGMRFRVSSLPSRLADAAAPLEAAGAALLVDPGRGLLYARFLVGSAPEAAVAAAVDAARAAARAGGGAWLLEAAPRFAKEGRDVFGDPTPVLPLLRALKRQYDPDAILNPGRFVGGI